MGKGIETTAFNLFSSAIWGKWREKGEGGSQQSNRISPPHWGRPHDVIPKSLMWSMWEVEWF